MEKALVLTAPGAHRVITAKGNALEGETS